MSSETPLLYRHGFAVAAACLWALAGTPVGLAAEASVALELLATEQGPLEMCSSELGSLELGIRNSGRDAVRIERIIHNAGCNCIQVQSFLPEHIAGGQTTRIKLAIDTTGKRHDFEVLFQIVTDVNETIPVKNGLSIKILQDISLSPSLLEVGRVAADAPLDLSMVLSLDRSGDANDITLQAVHPTTRCDWGIQESAASRLSGAGPAYRLRLQTQAPFETGPFEALFHLSIANDRGRIRRFKITVSGTVVPAITTKPTRLFLGYVQADSVITTTVELLCETHEAFTILGIESAAVDVVDYRVGRVTPFTYTVEVSVKVPRAPTGGIMKAPLRILVQLADERAEVEIPCIYTLAAPR